MDRERSRLGEENKVNEGRKDREVNRGKRKEKRG